MPYVDALRASAEVVPTPLPPATSATPEESERILRWLDAPGVRVVDIDGAWTCPVGGATGVRHALEPVEMSKRATPGFRSAG